MWLERRSVRLRGVAPGTSPVARGMQAQLDRRRAELGGGAVGIGWKIGFDTPAMQQHFGLN